MNEQARLRQLYLRTLLALGIVWGCALFIAAPFIFQGNGDTTFDVAATLFNSLTIMPACILAFWHRRMACVWLTINALGVSLLVNAYFREKHHLEASAAVGLAVPLLLTAFLDIMEFAKWPAALKQKSQ